MTVLILTLHEKFAVLSQDTIISDTRAIEKQPALGVATDEEEQRRSAFVGDGSPPKDRVGLGQQSKITIAPHVQLIAGYSGRCHWMTQWDIVARNAPVRDVVELHAMIPQLVRTCDRNLSGEGSTAVHVGWSPTDRRMRGFLYSSQNQWTGMELPKGHCLYPACDPDDSDYDKVLALAAKASAGEAVEEFHLALAMNIHRAFLRGRYIKGAIIGGQLHTVRVDAECITARVAHVFDLGG
mgnify:FL=1